MQNTDEVKQVIETLKRNGDFDSFRKEIFDSFMNGELMKNILSECDELVRETIQTAPLDLDAAQMRKRVKDKLDRKHFTHRIAGDIGRLLRQPASTSAMEARIEELSRDVLGMPKKEEPVKEESTNMEVIDMEVDSIESSSPRSEDKEVPTKEVSTVEIKNKQIAETSLESEKVSHSNLTETSSNEIIVEFEKCHTAVETESTIAQPDIYDSPESPVRIASPEKNPSPDVNDPEERPADLDSPDFEILSDAENPSSPQSPEVMPTKDEEILDTVEYPQTAAVDAQEATEDAQNITEIQNLDIKCENVNQLSSPDCAETVESAMANVASSIFENNSPKTKEEPISGVVDEEAPVEKLQAEPAIVIKEKIEKTPREKTGVTPILVEQAKVFKEGRLVSSSPSCSSSSDSSKSSSPDPDGDSIKSLMKNLPLPIWKEVVERVIGKLTDPELQTVFSYVSNPIQVPRKEASFMNFCKNSVSSKKVPDIEVHKKAWNLLLEEVASNPELQKYQVENVNLNYTSKKSRKRSHEQAANSIHTRVTHRHFLMPRNYRPFPITVRPS
uniref:BOD1/SHG1 domain-containing protein n=1 Tax=Acrobeloides nanus TaxID=290746 RepID=A0A914E2W8_9BILA